jgi:hypothetical protein
MDRVAENVVAEQWLQGSAVHNVGGTGEEFIADAIRAVR